MIIKDHISGKYIIVEKKTNHQYFHTILMKQYNVNVHIPKMNQVQMIRNNIDTMYFKQ